MQDADDGAPPQFQFVRDAPAVPAQTAQPFNLRDNGRAGLPCRTKRTRGAVPEVGHSVLPITAEPLGGLGAPVEAGRSQLQHASHMQNRFWPIALADEP